MVIWVIWFIPLNLTREKLSNMDPKYLKYILHGYQNTKPLCLEESGGVTYCTIYKLNLPLFNLSKKGQM